MKLKIVIASVKFTIEPILVFVLICVQTGAIRTTAAADSSRAPTHPGNIFSYLPIQESAPAGDA